MEHIPPGISGNPAAEHDYSDESLRAAIEDFESAAGKAAEESTDQTTETSELDAADNAKADDIVKEVYGDPDDLGS